METWRLDLHGAVDTMTLDQLRVMSTLLKSVKDPGAQYMAGTLSGIMHAKFGTCLMCDKDHTELPEDLLVERSEDQSDSGTVEVADDSEAVSMSDAEVNVRIFNYPFRRPTNEEVEAIVKLNANPLPPDDMTPSIRAKALRLMDVYNLDDAWDEDTKAFLGYACKSCGRIYASIQDRLLRPPGIDGCLSCQNRAGQG